MEKAILCRTLAKDDPNNVKPIFPKIVLGFERHGSEVSYYDLNMNIINK